MAKALDIIQKERKNLTDFIVKNMEEKGLSWSKGWIDITQENATTNLPYKGGNKIKLMTQGEKDPRWVTFTQAKNQGWKVKKGAKSVLLEKWIFTKKEKNPKTGEVEEEKLIRPFPTYFRVFNAKHIEGISKYIKPIDKNQTNEKIDEIATILKKSSECPINEIKQNRAYYSLTRDEIVLPLKEDFISSQEYLGAMIHEMGHSTGHKSRLNRSMKNEFGSEGYAKEELRAELSSVFTQQELGVTLEKGSKELDNHSAYLKSWIKVLRNDPNEIYRASADAEKITDRLVENYKAIENIKEKESKFTQKLKEEKLLKEKIKSIKKDKSLGLKEKKLALGKLKGLEIEM